MSRPYRIPTYNPPTLKDPQDANELGDFLAALRSVKPTLTQSAIADRIGLNRSTITDYEKGKIQGVPMGYLALLAKLKVEQWEQEWKLSASDLKEAQRRLLEEINKAGEDFYSKWQKIGTWTELDNIIHRYITERQTKAAKRKKTQSPSFTGPQEGTELPQRRDLDSRSNAPLDRPKRIKHFQLRRDDELKELRGDLKLGQIVVLYGPPGMGKTALATQAVRALTRGRQLPRRFPDGILICNFSDHSSVNSALIHIARSFGEVEPETPDPYHAARRALLNRQALLVLDAVEQCDHWATILDVSGECGVLITTSRREDTGVGDKVHEVGIMPPVQSRQILEGWYGQTIAEKAAQEICDLVGCLPLALRIAGCYMAAGKLEPPEYLAMLKSAGLDVLSLTERHHESVRLLIEKSLDRADKATRGAKEAMAVVGLLGATSYDYQAIAAALDALPLKIVRLLKELVNYGLLDRVKGRYKVTHLLIHTYAKTELTPPEEATERLAAYYAKFVEQHGDDELGEPIGRGIEGNREKLSDEIGNILTIVDWCLLHRPAIGIKIEEKISTFLIDEGLWDKRDELSKRAMAAAEALGSGPDYVSQLIRRTWMTQAKGDLDQAEEDYHKAIKLAQRHRMTNRLVQAYRDLGLVFAKRADLERENSPIDYTKNLLEAEKWIGLSEKLAGKLAKGNGDKLPLWLSQVFAARVAYIRGTTEDLANARAELVGLLRQFQSRSDWRNMLFIYRYLAQIAIKQDDLAFAQTYLQKAAEILRRDKDAGSAKERYYDAHEEPQILEAWGDLEKAQGARFVSEARGEDAKRSFSKAREYYEKADKIVNKLGMKIEAARIRRSQEEIDDALATL